MSRFARPDPQEWQDTFDSEPAVTGLLSALSVNHGVQQLSLAGSLLSAQGALLQLAEVLR